MESQAALRQKMEFKRSTDPVKYRGWSIRQGRTARKINTVTSRPARQSSISPERTAARLPAISGFSTFSRNGGEGTNVILLQSAAVSAYRRAIAGATSFRWDGRTVNFSFRFSTGSPSRLQCRSTSPSSVNSDSRR